MGRLIKYELKKQQTSRNIILALLLVFLLAVVVWNLYREREYSWNQCNAGNVCRNVCIFLYGN